MKRGMNYDTPREQLESSEWTAYAADSRNDYVALNCQQLAKTPVFLDCLRAPKGYKFVQLDYTSLEPYVMAEFSEDPMYIELYTKGKPHDVYLYVVCKLLDPTGEISGVYHPDNPTAESVKATKKQFKNKRTIGKILQLMSTYKAGAAKIYRSLVMMGVDISISEVKSLRERYWGPDLFAGVLEFEEHLLEEVDQRGGWMINGTGRPLAVIERKRKDVLNMYCLAGDTWVYTKQGPKRITCVTEHDMVWFEGRWVTTKGVILRGHKEPTNFNGVYMTLNHKVVTRQGITSAGRAKVSDLKTTTRPRYGWTEFWRLCRSML